jgi:hypothetical protein
MPLLLAEFEPPGIPATIYCPALAKSGEGQADTN